MNINFKTRTELKNFFKKNAIPTAGNFADFIDAGVNQKDDGLLKPAGEPLSLEASIAATKPAIRFFESFVGNTNPSWVVSLIEPVSQQSAFVLSDALGNTRLWIGQNGAVTAPGALTVGSLTATGAGSAAGFTTTGLLSASAGANVIGAPLNVGTSAGTAQPLTVWGPLTANSTATVAGLLTANGGLASKNVVVNGKVAIGTATAGSALHVNGGATVGTFAPFDSLGSLNVTGGAAELGFVRRNLGAWPATPAAGDRFVWYNPDGVARLFTHVNGDLWTVKANGFTGVGVIDPQFRLEVGGRVRVHPEGNATAGLWLSGLGTSTSPVGDISFIGLMNNLAVGFWGNTGTAGWRLFVNTTTGDLAISGSNATKVGGATTWNISSDARLKHNIAPLHDALDRLLQLRGATYEWRAPETQGNETGTQIGFIGQEVEKVFPEWILEGEDGYKVLSIRGFEALAVEALRELRAENQALKQSYRDLQAEITRLAARSQGQGEAP